jgi:bisphosphoglycerate-independent phosphoglycerate mutase (AlkP superfamily)
MASSRPRPLVLVALDTPAAPALARLSARFPRCELGVDPVDAIVPADFSKNPMLLAPFKKAKELGGRVHLFGLLSDGGVHASLADLYGLIAIAEAQRVRVVVHAILDGVDVPPKSYERYLSALEQRLDISVGRIGTVSGRGYAMDVDGRWDRIEKVYKAVAADGAKRFDSALAGVQEACMFGAPEAFVEPFIAFDYPGVSPVDTALHFHFGASRARELCRALSAPSFDRFARKGGKAAFQGRLTCMTPYDDSLGLPSAFARAPDPTSLPFEALAAARLGQQRVTRGGVAEIAKQGRAAVDSGDFDFVLIDFASPDDPAARGAPDLLDGEVTAIVDAALANGGAAVVLGGRNAAGTVPLIVARGERVQLKADGSTADLAATLLALLELPQPDDVEGSSILL